MDQPAGKHPENPWLGKHVLIEMMNFIMAIYQQNFNLSCLDNATWQDSKIRSGLEPADLQVDLLISLPGLIHRLVNASGGFPPKSTGCKVFNSASQ